MGRRPKFSFRVLLAALSTSDPGRLTQLSIVSRATPAQYLRGTDWKYRESVDRLKKSKILITCQKSTFGELSSKISFKLSGALLFSRNSEKTVLLN